MFLVSAVCGILNVVIFTYVISYNNGGEIMGRKAMMYFAAVVIIMVTTLAFVLFARGETYMRNIEFLNGYGWEV